LQVFHRLLQEIGERPDADVGAAAAVAQDLDELGFRPLQRAASDRMWEKFRFDANRRTAQAPVMTEICALSSLAMKTAGLWLSCGPNMNTCRSPRVFQIRLVRNASGL
jgi:hypothetical protein